MFGQVGLGAAEQIPELRKVSYYTHYAHDRQGGERIEDLNAGLFHGRAAVAREADPGLEILESGCEGGPEVVTAQLPRTQVEVHMYCKIF